MEGKPLKQGPNRPDTQVGSPGFLKPRAGDDSGVKWWQFPKGRASEIGASGDPMKCCLHLQTCKVGVVFSPLWR